MTAMLWFAVHTKSQREAEADRHLRRQGFTTFFPHVSEWVGIKGPRSRLVKKAWLSRYLFVETEPGQLHLVNDTPDVSTLVHAAGNDPFPIPAPIIEAMQSKCDPLGELHMAEPKVKGAFGGGIGDRVRFAEGNAFWGLYGEIQRVLGDSLLVELDKALMGQTKATVPVGYVAEVFKAS
jgi:transcription antitermination factor NusG